MVSIIKQDRIIVLLSKASTRQGFFKLIDAVLDSDMNARCAHIIFDFKAVESWGLRALVVLSNLIEVLRQAGVQVDFINYRMCKAISLLERSGFGLRYFHNETTVRMTTTSEMLPLELVDYAGSHSYIQNRLIPWLEAALKTHEGGAAAIDVCMKEVFNNIVDHSTVNVGSSIAWKDPHSGRLEICASDFGIGIPKNVRKREPGLTDEKAVLLACQEGFTTQTSPRNMGAGLAILMRNVVDRNQGRVLLYSGNGYVARSAFPGETQNQNVLTKVGYPGTLVHITLNPDTFVFEDAQEVFEW